jgi:PAS domain S-box-containing protein
MRLQKSVRYLASLILLVALFSLFFTFQSARRDSDTFALVNHTHKVIEETDKIHAGIVDMESQVRGFAISGNGAFLDNLARNRASLGLLLLQLRGLTADNPQQQRTIAQLQVLVEKKLRFQDEILATQKRSQADALALISSLQGKVLGDSIKLLSSRMEGVERALLVSRIAANRSTASNRFIFSIIVAVGSLVFLTLALIKINREILRRQGAEILSRESEIKYKGLIENSAVVIFSADTDGYFQYVSNKCFDLTGYTPAELVGKHYTVLIHEDWLDIVQNFYVQQIQSRVPETELRFPIKTREGYEKWVEQNIVLLRENGAPIGFQSIVKDVTETKLGEDLLQAAETQLKMQQEENQFRLQAILDNMPMVVYIKDLEGRFLLVNKGFKETFGVTDEMAQGRYAHDISKSQDAALRFATADREVMKTLRPVEMEDVVMTTAGERNMLVTKFPLFDQNNKLFAISGVDKDITDMVRNREQLIAAKLRAEQAEKLQEEFLANMSHEIRTPMNGIIGMTNLLTETTLTEEQKEFVLLIRQSSDTLHVLINDILDLSKIKAGRMTVEEVSFSPTDVVDGALASVRATARNKQITLERFIDPALPGLIRGDQHKLSQILTNLVSNAVKFTDRGEIGLRADVVSTGAETIMLRFEVRDTGIGIPEEHLDTIFDSFVQAGDDTMRRFGGTGLGLSITKRLIELQGGRISVNSRTGEGSTFRLEISYGHALQEERVKQGSAPAETEGTEKLRGKRILLVEDNPVNQKVTYHLLQKAGLEVEIANDGKVAVELLERGHRYDLIIMDLQMQDMNGFQTTLYIRQKLKLRTPIIAMTASALRNEKEKCFEIGMDEYLTKPFVPADLFRHLHRFLAPGSGPKEVPLPASPAPRFNQPYDLSFVKEMDDAEYTIEILQVFLETTPPTLEALRDDALYENWEAVFQGAHKLKSSVGVLQMNQLLEQVTEVEQSAKLRQNLGSIPGLVKNIMHQYSLIKPMLEAELAEAREEIC